MIGFVDGDASDKLFHVMESLAYDHHFEGVSHILIEP